VEVMTVRADYLEIHACADLYDGNQTKKVMFGSVHNALVSICMWVILIAFISCNFVSAQYDEYNDAPMEPRPAQLRLPSKDKGTPSRGEAAEHTVGDPNNTPGSRSTH
jgi:hypothetical protein